MNLLIDQNLPPALAVWFRNQGEDAVHVREIDMRNSSDHEIAREAKRREAVILTKDSDYSEGMPVPVVWLRIGNATNRRLFQVLEHHWVQIKEGLQAGERVISIED
ncbi:MAG: DUF5615 family PIN-like protein [Pseudomonadota bacterium]